MIQQEELHIKQFTTGVTFFIFSDTIYNQLPENPDQYEGPFPSYIVFNLQNEIYSLNYFTGNTIWTRNDNNNYIPIGEMGWNYQTGYTLVKTIASDLSQENIDNMSNLMLSRLSDPTRPGTPPSASAATNYVFYRKKLIDDFYVDLKLERSYNSLDTLKINNNLINSFPDQSSPTGVVFGRLTAIQKIKGENGENLRIPLKNVPIGIFNSSDDFPTISSTDDNGDRLTLNIKESSIPSDYFDNLSYYTDYNNYLRSAESFSAVPAQYKYITKTNENGEFIIYDVPVGEQVAIFEVDLFKQGLTKDEIALNFFPFPPTIEPNIDTLPSFAFKQFPIEVVPAWGLGQTGYTSLDININLDLRKWTTYILPPVTLDNRRLNITTAQNPSRALKVDVRDMTSPNFTKRPIEIVQVPDDLDRDIGAQYLWFNEFTQKKTSIKYNNFGCSVFKLPGNVYDPYGYRTDSDGNPTSNRGVWLAAYQLNIYIDKVFSQRTTGAAYYTTTQGSFTRSHYHLNYTEGNLLGTPVDGAAPQIGVFPYEKPWSATYPEPYSIPRKPTQQRFQWGPERFLYPSSTSSSLKYYIEEPAYSDGDLVGIPVSNSIGNAGGFGVQAVGTSWFYNRIANVATNTFMYKYESGVAKKENYANGYEPHWDPSNSPYTYNEFPFAGISKVVGGEKYQRLECGHGYFVRPQGWSRIVREAWGADIPKDVGFLTGYGTSENPGPSTVSSGLINGWFYRKPYPLTIYNIDNQNLALHLGQSSIKEGTLDFYRIVKSGPNENGEFVNLSPPENFIIPTYSSLKIEGAAHCYNIRITNKGTNAVTIINPYRGSVRLLSSGGYSTIGFAAPGLPFTLQPNESFELADKPAQAAWLKYDYNGNPRDGEDFGPAASSPNQPQSSHDGTQYLVSLFNDTAYWRHSVDFTTIRLPGNAQYNSDTNRFEKSLYGVDVEYYDRYKWSQVATNGNLGLETFSIGDAIVSYIGDSKGRYERTILIQERNSLFNPDGGINSEIQYGTFYGDANVNSSNYYYIRTNTNGSNSGLVHEGIGKNFFYGNEFYYNAQTYNNTLGNDEWIELYSLAIEGPTSSLWGEFNDGNEDFGYGRYSP